MSYISVDPLTIKPYLSIISCQGAYISHFNHWLSKIVKEFTLTISKAVYNVNCVSPSSWEQLLISLEKALVVLKVCEVVIIKAIRSRGIKIGYGIAIPTFRTCLAKCSQVCCVQARVWVSSAIEVVKPLTENPTLCPPKCMCTWKTTISIKIQNVSLLHIVKGSEIMLITCDI